MKLSFLFAFVLVSTSSIAGDRFVGEGISEATGRFRQSVVVHSNAPLTFQQAESAIRNQIRYVVSGFRMDKTAMIKDGYFLSNLQISPQGPGQYRVQYDFSGVFVVKNQEGTSLNALLPIDPEMIYSRSLVNGRPACAFDHPEESLFWYSWRPRMGSCPLIEGVDYVRFKIALTRIPNTRSSYPEYSRLVNHGEILLFAFFGKQQATDFDEPTGGTGFNGLANQLRAWGYSSRRWSDTEIGRIVPSDAKYPRVTEYNLRASRANVRVISFYGDTGLYDESKAFHYFYKYALENGAVISYNGHAGNGMNLDISMISQRQGLTISPDRSRYQIVQFNACLPYFYYNQDYFNWKASSADPKGTLNLDILAEGVEGAFDRMARHAVVLLDAIQSWARGNSGISYQTLSQRLGGGETLYGIAGDEDNPTQLNR